MKLDNKHRLSDKNEDGLQMKAHNAQHCGLLASPYYFATSN